MKHIIAGFAFATAAFVAQAAVVEFVPSSRTVLIGDTFTVDIIGTGFPATVDGGGFDIGLSSPGTIRFVVPGADLTVADITFATGWNFLISPGVLDGGAGTVKDLFFNGFPGVSGPDFKIATLKFMATARGESDIFLTANAFAFGSNGDAVSVDFSKAEVVVVPEPSTWVLLAGGLLLGGWVAAKRNRGDRR